ncbi:MAG TPA: hypothetical protein VH519_05575 [Hyphomicrobiaceae bacterium]|jgi:hypothetical protein
MKLIEPVCATRRDAARCFGCVVLAAALIYTLMYFLDPGPDRGGVSTYSPKVNAR